MPYEGVKFHADHGRGPDPATLAVLAELMGLISWKLNYDKDPIVEAVIVTGSGPNRFGHALLYISGCDNEDGRCPIGYFHVTDPGVTHARYIPENMFDHYLQDNNKAVLGRFRIADISEVGKFAMAVHKSLTESWLYGLVVNNCVTYVEKMLKKGGSGWRIPKFNTPTTALLGELVKYWYENRIISGATDMTWRGLQPADAD